MVVGGEWWVGGGVEWVVVDGDAEWMVVGLSEWWVVVVMCGGWSLLELHSSRGPPASLPDPTSLSADVGHLLQSPAKKLKEL